MAPAQYTIARKKSILYREHTGKKYFSVQSATYTLKNEKMSKKSPFETLSEQYHIFVKMSIDLESSYFRLYIQIRHLGVGLNGSFGITLFILVIIFDIFIDKKVNRI